MVAVRRDPDPREGDVVIARIGGEITLERYHRARDCVERHPESHNPEHEIIRVDPDTDNFEIAGVVVGAVIGTPRGEGNTEGSPARDAGPNPP